MTALLIGITLFLGSFAGLLYIIGRKFPLLLALPVKEKEGLAHFLSQGVGAKLQNLKVSKFVRSPELMLQHVLSKARIMSLKTEVKTNDWLVKLRKKSKEKQEKFSASYWDKFKKKG